MTANPVSSFMFGPAYSGVAAVAEHLRHLKRPISGHSVFSIPQRELYRFAAPTVKTAGPGAFPPITEQTEAAYTRAFKGRGHRLDCTEINAYWPGALREIHKYSPQARVVCVLREPLERIYHHANANLSAPEGSYWKENAELDELGGVEYRVREYAGSGYHARSSYYHQSEYLRMINDVLEVFPDALFIDWGTFRNETRACTRRIMEHFFVDGSDHPASYKRDRNYWSPKHTPLNPINRALVWKRCVGDFHEIEGRTGVKTDPWLLA